ncbi:hypothetical protein MGSAQ_002916 [marine sediment metagenome]|uniref:Uncharacterized protein n=1 Tax=marine sediment metagenome TaxID=412755 RepID=A0A1B6NQ93_9ZZZZ
MATSSYFNRFLRASKSRLSTLPCAFSIDFDTILCSMASSSLRPMARIILTTRSPAKIRIKSSSSDKKKRDIPGSP